MKHHDPAKKKRKRGSKHGALLVSADPTETAHHNAHKERRALGSEKGALDVRIKQHGKISSYVEFITGRLETGDADRLYVYAEGAAVSKLVTVVEIVKRKNQGRYRQQATVGDTAASPCSRLQRSKEDHVASESAKEEDKPVPKKASGEAWMQVAISAKGDDGAAQ
ncbi:hypothetical protein GGI11_006779 [Coemansia sp. RSA 2049]|nr:hypothetical protein GGI11_006779 [Coemansia sp. RSA 2049]KAJ2587971.1 hypothetical protein EV177_009497 [Coemansia sp. RSA 1804]KAJ2694913.1 hypothetical protein GGH99_000424 [Coemansia sp. RSA 1285]